MKIISILLILSLLLCGCTVVGTEPADQSTAPPATETTALPTTVPPTAEATVPPATEVPPTQPPVDPAWLAGSAQQGMADPAYWGGSDEPVLSGAQIDALNARILATPGTGLRDLLAVPETIPGSEIQALIEQYAITKPLLDGETPTAEELADLEAERNLQGIPETVTPGYGIVTAPADLRSYPTGQVNSAGTVLSGSDCVDRFQQTRLRLGEGVIVCHSSASGDWLFVLAGNYCGWVEARLVGLCSRQEMADYIGSDRFAVALERRELDGMTVDMGTRLALDESGALLLPCRRADGELELTARPMADFFCQGYLPYTTNNLYRQAMALLGTPYSWGSKEGLDCSDTLVSIYACFGIRLPRDSAAMALLGVAPGEVFAPSPGALLVMSGHVMLYLGTVDGEVYVLQNITHYRNAAGEQTPVIGAVISSTSDIFLQNGHSFLEDIVRIVEIA